jgi:hypothetical protein
MPFELKDDAKEISYEAVGLALHLDSRTLALLMKLCLITCGSNENFMKRWKHTEAHYALKTIHVIRVPHLVLHCHLLVEDINF